MQLSKKRINHGAGFTLIELMVVIAIIAILSSIMLVNFNAAKSRSRDGQRISDTAQIQLALAGYFNQCNQYPQPDTTTVSGKSVVDQNTLTQNTGCPSGITFSSFISKVPTPPAGAGQTYYDYIIGNNSAGNPGDYVLHATLEGNSSVSSESIQTIPTDITSLYGVTCDSGVNYCLGPK